MIPKQIFIMRSIVGQGKSHIANILSKGLQNALILSADELRLYDGEYKFIPENEDLIWDRFEELLYEAFEDGIENIIIDNTNLKRINYDGYKRDALERGYLVHEIIVGDFNVDDAFSRCKHNVPKDKIQGMKDAFEFPS